MSRLVFLYSNDSIRAYICISVIVFILGVPILVMGTWLTKQPSTACETYLNTPLIVLGVLIIIFSLLGIYYAKKLKGLQLCLHGYIMFVLLSVLLGYTIFALVVTGPGGGEHLARRGYKEYRLEDYSHWLQKRVNNTKHWNNHLKSCVFNTHVCSKFLDKYGHDTQDQFFSRPLSSIESGCCKPSNDCNFNYTKPTEWRKPTDGVYTNKDCYAWNNDPNVLCFNCQSCKAGLTDDVKRNWKKASTISIVFVILLIIFSFMGCIVIENPS